MSQNDFVIDNGTGLAVRQDIESAFQALASNNSGSSTPSTTYAYQFWADTSAATLKIRNSANNAWIELLQLDGTLTLEDGSASAPALGFRDDLDTGVFSAGANIFNIATGGSERVRVDSSGQVGINDNSPDAELAVAAVSGNAPHIDIGQAGGNRFKLGYEGNNCFLGASSSTGMFLFKNNVTAAGHPQADGTELVRITGDGNVGIGTTAPDTPLTVSRATTGNVLKGLSTNNNTRSRIELTGKDSSGNAVTLNLGGDGDFGGMVFTNTNHKLGFSTNNAAPQMVLDTSANVGIGTTSPSAKLEVNGDAIINSLNIGRGAGNVNSNTVLGSNALINNTSGGDSVSVGKDSLRTNTEGSRLVGCGQNALYYNQTGNDCTAVGNAALLNNTANSNTALGSTAGDLITSGSNNTCLGFQADPSSATVDNEITLGNSSIVTLRCNVQVISSLSDARDKTNVIDLPEGLNFISKLRPVKFEWATRDGNIKDGSYEHGFIAQDLQAAQKENNADYLNMVMDENPDRLEASYGKLVPILVNAVKELLAKVEALEAA